MENPKIRFKGFTKDWEQRNVSEITKFHKQGFYTTEEYDNSKKYYLLRGTDLTENKLVLKDTPKIDATEKDYDAFKTEIGDFLIVRSGTVGTYGIVDVDIPAIFGSYLIDFRFDMEQVTNEFFGYFYQSSLFKSQLNKIIQASANTNINAENIKSTVISLPSLNEQRRISEYLGNLDNLITLHQRKCEQTKKLKKYMLQKMFPQNGAKVPEIRFYGFTYDWEQRKFSDIASRESVSRESSYDLPSLEYEDVIAEEGRLNKDISLKENIKKGIVFDGSQVLYGKLRPYLHNWLNPDFSGVAVGDWWVLKPNNADKSFIYRLIQTQRFDDIANQSAGSKMPRADWNLVSNTEFAVPVSQEEQEKIGEYFSSLDHLITLHQRQTDFYKKISFYYISS